jgi:hypothetical protein
MRELEKWKSAMPERISGLSNRNHATAKMMAVAVIALAAWVVAANFPTIRRYVRIEMM